MRKKVVLICTQCLSRNYQVSVKVEGKTERIEMMKFCPKCNQHTLHKESK
ncbi:MAG: 50S ribosomal protein L33 [Bacilli bacterium]|nr:50S ribosomal protein L33 1 [Firmicutes bacterium CAG:345]